MVNSCQPSADRRDPCSGECFLHTASFPRDLPTRGLQHPRLYFHPLGWHLPPWGGDPRLASFGPLLHRPTSLEFVMQEEGQ